MPLPRLLAQINKRTFNKAEIRKGKRPVLIHVGRRSGTTHETPLDAHAIAGGYLFFPLYGPESDWVKNVMETGSARLRVGGHTIDLEHPRLIRRVEVRELMPDTQELPSKRLGINSYLRMATK